MIKEAINMPMRILAIGISAVLTLALLSGCGMFTPGVNTVPDNDVYTTPATNYYSTPAYDAYNTPAQLVPDKTPRGTVSPDAARATNMPNGYPTEMPGVISPSPGFGATGMPQNTPGTVRISPSPIPGIITQRP